MTKHTERMAELRGLYYDPSEPPRIGKFATDALAYADELAAKLEAERAAQAEWEAALCKALDERNVATLKLQAAELVVEAARPIGKRCSSSSPGSLPSQLSELSEALSAYDALTDTSKGGAGEGVG